VETVATYAVFRARMFKNSRFQGPLVYGFAAIESRNHHSLRESHETIYDALITRFILTDFITLEAFQALELLV
jgi:hypothetical protein